MKNTKTEIKFNTKFIFTPILVAFLSFFMFSFPVSASEMPLEKVVRLTNQARLENNLNGLVTSPLLNNVASQKAQHMTKYHYFSHTSPDGIDPWYWFRKEGYSYKYAGENLAINYKSAEEQQSAWMDSPTHRKNILNPNYEEIGVATASGYINGKPAIITVQVFGSPQTTVGTKISQKQKITPPQNTFSIPYVLGEQSKYPTKTQYIKTSPKLIAQKESRLPISNDVLSAVKKQTHNLMWGVLLILAIIIIRDIVLSSINSPVARHHSITNLILLVMLWSFFIGM